MPAVPLAIGAYDRADAFQPETLCVNFYLEEDKSGASPDGFLRLQRPGLSAFATGAGQIRGLYQQDGVLSGTTFGVWGEYLHSVTSGVTTSIGWVGAGSRVPFAANYEKLFLLSSTVAFQYDGLAVDGIEMPDARDVEDIDTFNNFTLLLCPDGRYYWMEPGSNVVDEFNFATAESSPDGAVAIRRLGDEFIIFGRTSSEVWQATGNDDAPFLKAGGRTMDRGAMSRDAVKPFDNSIIWPGEDGIIYRLGNVPQRISTHGIEERIRKRTGDLSAIILEHDGHKFYVLNIPGQGAHAYDPATGLWPEFDWASGAPLVATGYEGGFLLGDDTNGKIYLFDPASNADDTVTMTRKLTGTIALMGRAGRQDSFSVGIGSSADCTLNIRWKDGQDDYPAYYEEMDARAPMDVVNIYRLGMPEQPFRTFELMIDEDVKVRIAGAMANEAWQ